MKRPLLTLTAVLSLGALALSPADATTASTSNVRMQLNLPDDFNPVAIGAVSPSNVWLVGNPQYGGEHNQARFEHWDGSRWSQAAIPAFSSSSVSDLLTFSVADAWAIGRFGDDRILHWDGTSWTAVAVPGMPASAFLSSMSGAAADDVWAVGQRDIGSRRRAFVVHWDGTTWSTVGTSRPPAHVYVDTRDVSVVNDHDVWMTQYQRDEDTGRGYNFLEHWDGHRWTEIPGLDGKPHFDVTGVLAISGSDVWATGDATARRGHGVMLYHWDGSAWTSIRNPAPPNSFVMLDAVSSTDVWAVGASYTGDHPTTYKPLSMHWDGADWTTFPIEGGRAPRDFMTDVSADRTDDVWACGYSAGRPIVRHWDGSTWS